MLVKNECKFIGVVRCTAVNYQTFCLLNVQFSSSRLSWFIELIPIFLLLKNIVLLCVELHNICLRLT